MGGIFKLFSCCKKELYTSLTDYSDESLTSFIDNRYQNLDDTSSIKSQSNLSNMDKLLCLYTETEEENLYNIQFWAFISGYVYINRYDN